jgi:hypothetical protein
VSRPLDDLRKLLDLEKIELNLFRGTSPSEGWQRVFGGQVLAQARVAAKRTVEEGLLRPVAQAWDRGRPRRARLEPVLFWPALAHRSGDPRCAKP